MGMHSVIQQFFSVVLYALSHAMISFQTPGSVPLAKRREDDVSVGSTPLVTQPSNQASDYASSPVKTKTVTGRFTSTRCATDARNTEDVHEICEIFCVLSITRVNPLLWGHHTSKHVLLCFPLLLIILDAQNRWVAWLCGDFICASFPLSGTPLFRPNMFSAHWYAFTDPQSTCMYRHTHTGR